MKADNKVQPSPGLGVRHIQIFILFTGVTIGYMLRVNLSVAIVAMTDPTVNPQYPSTNWTIAQQGTVLSSFFWGYVITPLPSSILANRYGPTKLYVYTMLLSGSVTFLFPSAVVYGGIFATCFARFLQGLGQGFMFPCTNAVLARWSVPQERGKFVTFTFSGCTLGTLIGMTSTGFLAAGPTGWPSVFYIAGVVNTVWCFFSWCYLSEGPDSHKKISEKERDFITKILQETTTAQKNLKTPWKGILSSCSVWCLIYGHSMLNWCAWTLLTFIPIFMKGILHFDIKKNGVLSALPYVGNFLTSLIVAYMVDVIYKKQFLSVNVARKTWNSISMYGSAITLSVLAFMATEATRAIVLLTLTVSILVFSLPGVMSNFLDLTPNFSGILMGISNTFAILSALLAPLAAGLIITDPGNVTQWRIVFMIAVVNNCIANTVFIIFGSTKIEKWNTVEEM